MMPAWIALIGMALSVAVVFLSHRSVRTADRTGDVKFLFWRVASRSNDNWYFTRKQRFGEARTLFFGLLALLFAAYFLEAVGAFNQ